MDSIVNSPTANSSTVNLSTAIWLQQLDYRQLINYYKFKVNLATPIIYSTKGSIIQSLKK